MHETKPNKTIKRHNGPKLSPGQTSYGPEAARRTKRFQRTLSQDSGSPLGKPKSTCVIPHHFTQLSLPLSMSCDDDGCVMMEIGLRAVKGCFDDGRLTMVAAA
nr:hypothetical protein [Tanacetum cinerariifolium]